MNDNETDVGMFRRATSTGESKDLAVLYAKIARVTAAMKRVPKNGHNKFQNYDYATESDIVGELRKAMGEEKLAIIPFVESTERIEHKNEKLGPITRINMKFIIACGDTGASMCLPWIGDGQDTADKGLYKAYTGAEKYFLMKLFMVATGDDPEQDSEQQAQPTNQQRQQPSIAERRAKTINAIKNLWVQEEASGGVSVEQAEEMQWPLEDYSNEGLGKLYRAVKARVDALPVQQQELQAA